MHTDEPIGTAILYVESTVAPQALKDFTNWCNSIHHFDTMRIEGFLSMRRLETVASHMAPGMKRHELLTLYQVIDASAADFTTPAYMRHTETYVRPPSGVAGNIDFQRSIYLRVPPVVDTTQRIGRAMITIRTYGSDANSGPDQPAMPQGDILSAYRIRDASMAGLVINCIDLSEGQKVYDQILAAEHTVANSSVQLFSQAFPARGVLLRDRVFRE